MRAKKAKSKFKKYVKQRGSQVSQLRPAAGLEMMVGFYCDKRARDCDLTQEGDMLLFQWGTYDWGQGAYFEFDLVRQLIAGEGWDEDIYQLSLNFRFTPTDDLRALGSGNRWCATPQQVAAFADFVRASGAYVAVADRTPVSVTLAYECAG